MEDELRGTCVRWIGIGRAYASSRCSIVSNRLAVRKKKNPVSITIAITSHHSAFRHSLAP